MAEATARPRDPLTKRFLPGGTAEAEAPPRGTAPVFYNPKSPEEGILIRPGSDIVNFRFGRIQTEDPDLLAILERGAARGRYIKADADGPVFACPKCKLPWQSQKAYEVHIADCLSDR